MVCSMWLFKHKFHADGTLSRYKARLVANGSSQQLGVDFDKIFSPVIKLAIIRTVLRLAMSHKWSIHHLDVKNAFLNGDLSETIYMHQPPSFVDARFRNHGYQVTYPLLYVDDIILMSSSIALLQYLIKSLHHEFNMTDLGELNYFLGISDVRHSTGLFLFWKKYALQLLERAHVVNCNPSLTPIDTESKLGLDGVLKVVLVGDGVEEIKDMVEDKSHLIMYLIGDHFCALKMLTKVFVVDRNRGRGGSISIISGRGGGWFAIHSMDSNNGSSGGLVVLDGKCSKESIKVGGDGGVVSSGVVLGVVSSSVGEKLFGAKGGVGGDSRSMDGGATL
ncbi:ribonuclease H-like domain-containing protein [Tanacetum coccineum]